MQLWHIRRLIHRRTTQDISRSLPGWHWTLEEIVVHDSAWQPLPQGIATVDSGLPALRERLSTATSAASSSERSRFFSARSCSASARRGWQAVERASARSALRAPPIAARAALQYERSAAQQRASVSSETAPRSRARSPDTCGQVRGTLRRKLHARSRGERCWAASSTEPRSSRSACQISAVSRLYLGCISAVSRLLHRAQKQPQRVPRALWRPARSQLCRGERGAEAERVDEADPPSHLWEGPGTTTSEQVHAEPRRRPRRVTSASPPPPRKLSRATAATCSGRPTARKESCGLDA